jgi:hypothetical protein
MRELDFFRKLDRLLSDQFDELAQGFWDILEPFDDSFKLTEETAHYMDACCYALKRKIRALYHAVERHTSSIAFKLGREHERGKQLHRLERQQVN